MPHKNAAAHYHSAKKYRDRAREHGLCYICQKPPVPGKKRCQPCLDRDNRLSRESHARKKAAGLCVRCGLTRGDDGTVNHCRTCADKILAQKLDLKLACFDAYGGRHCACCGESILGFLTIDHVNNDGNEHRRTTNRQSIYQILRREGYPPGYQVLCFNCNSGRALNGGVCPHKQDGRFQCRASPAPTSAAV